MNLNARQLAAADHYRGAMLVIAGPGSGKTAVIVHRIKNLIEQHQIHPENILTVTFTKAAALQMENRFRSLTCGKGYHPAFGTFHSIFYKMLKIAGTSPPKILSSQQKNYMLKSELSRFKTDSEDQDDLLKELESWISRCKNDPRYPESVQSDPTVPAYYYEILQTYQKALQRENLLDFDDITLNTFHLLLNDTGTLSYWQDYFRFLLIDEFQDINRLQYEIVLLLSAKWGNLFAVGDDDQNIYSFRGASADIMKTMQSDFPECKSITLSQNYRCPNTILLPARKLIRNNHNRIKKQITSNVSENDSHFTITAFATQEAQYHAIAKQISEYYRHGMDYTQMAVLLRGSRDIPFICSIFSSNGIPVPNTAEQKNIFGHFVTIDILAYLKAASGIATRKDLLRIINRPSRYISSNALPEDPKENLFPYMKRYYRKNPAVLHRIQELQTGLSFLVKLPPDACITYISKGLGYEGFLRQYCRQKHLSMEKCIDVLKQLEKSAKEYRSINAFIEFLQIKADTKFPSEQTSETHCINILTMHAAKGLEFAAVFLPDLNESVIPSSHAKEEAAICEERRLLYVAMTRSSKDLHLSYCTVMNHKQSTRSFFLDEIQMAHQCTPA